VLPRLITAIYARIFVILGVVTVLRAGGQSAFSNDTRRRSTIRDIIKLTIAATLFLASVAYAQSDRPEISFTVTREGEFLRTDAHVDLPVAPAAVWAVLTDYERYPHFISSMRESKIVARRPEGLVVAQKGSFSFLFFAQEIDARLLVSEFPPNVIESRAIEGDFRVMQGRYEILQRGSAVRLSYTGRLQPNFILPPIIGTSIVRYVLLRNLREMVDEILRRDAATDAAAR
jgi:ribosome-associated toxin RatA of RatAB toxin-antitoxin module